MSEHLRISALWYEDGPRGRASLRLVTDTGHWHQDVDLSREAYRSALRQAKRHGWPFVVAHALRDVVAPWEPVDDKSPFERVFGKWPGDESDEEIEAMLKGEERGDE
jgi:hypothetical protein